MREWILRHTDLVGLALAALAASAAMDVFRAGVAIGEARALEGELDRLASEALGG